jgi:hypothetical protein
VNTKCRRRGSVVMGSRKENEGGWDAFPACGGRRQWALLARLLDGTKLGRAITEPERFGEHPEFSAWTWNADAILASASVPSPHAQCFDPTSLYHSILRTRLKDQSAGSNGTVFDAFARLRTIDEASFFEVIGDAIRQTHYVTLRCHDAISPARSHKRIGAAVKEFLRQEEGHHKLVAASLAQISSTWESDTRVLDSTRAMMAVLEYSARRNAAALCSCVGNFEGSAYDETDPFAELLSKSSKPAAAAGLQRHFLINKREAHSLVGRNWSLALNGLSKNEALEAVRLAELLVILEKVDLKSMRSLSGMYEARVEEAGNPVGIDEGKESVR